MKDLGLVEATLAIEFKRRLDSVQGKLFANRDDGNTDADELRQWAALVGTIDRSYLTGDAEWWEAKMHRAHWPFFIAAQKRWATLYDEAEAETDASKKELLRRQEIAARSHIGAILRSYGSSRGDDKDDARVEEVRRSLRDRLPKLKDVASMLSIAKSLMD